MRQRVVTSETHLGENAMDRHISRLGRWFVVLGFAFANVMGLMPAQAQELCGGVDYPFPYTDVSGVGAAFCPGIMEAYVTGVSKGTTPTTFSPDETVSRVQMTTFLQRSLDQGVMRASRRAALDQWWTNTGPMQTIAVALGGGSPQYCAGDGENIWVSIGPGGNQLVKVQASTGQVLDTWDDIESAFGIRVVAGMIFVTGATSPGNLYVIDPTQPPGVPVSRPVGNYPQGIAYDGNMLWTANRGPPGSLTGVVPATPYPVFTAAQGFNAPYGILYDGAHLWVTDTGAGTLLKLDSLGNILQTVTVGSEPAFPAFDGANIWVPNFADNSITVVQASTGNVVATINSDVNNQLSGPNAASFDGERILIANYTGNGVTVFKAADLSFVAHAITGVGTQPIAACSDGINFWIPLQGTTDLVRF
jgi:DNA-binding beta-propeller fold protein YncE